MEFTEVNWINESEGKVVRSINHQSYDSKNEVRQ